MPAAYETTQVFVTPEGRHPVPMFVTAKKGLPRDGQTPAWLYAYGGFGVSVVPSYEPWVPAWLEMGGIYAVPNLRGGGEYGEEWHRAGMREKKQNVFDDFIAAAEYLVREKYTSPARLVIEGGSNGGLLVGAAMTQRPELFAVALPAVGVMDMLRYHKFTGGAAWAGEYGSADDPGAFKYLFRYSPLHNLKPGTCYPATLVTTADHDDRVVPSHSYKFAAALQAAQGCDKPVLLRVETKGSHGYRPTDKLIAEQADLMAFVAAQLGLRATPAAWTAKVRPGCRSAAARSSWARSSPPRGGRGAGRGGARLSPSAATCGRAAVLLRDRRPRPRRGLLHRFPGPGRPQVTVDGHPSVFGGRFGKAGRRVDVLVLYDMPPDVPEARRANVQQYVDDGGAVVSLHHAISGSPRWAGCTRWSWVRAGASSPRPADRPPSSSTTWRSR